MGRCIGMDRECEFVVNKMCTATVSCPYIPQPVVDQLPAVKEVQKLIDQFRERIKWYPYWTDEIKNGHHSNREKEYQTEGQNKRMAEDRVILAALEQYNSVIKKSQISNFMNEIRALKPYQSDGVEK